MAKRVLLIEDEPNIIEALRFILSRDDWLVETRENDTRERHVAVCPTAGVGAECARNSRLSDKAAIRLKVLVDGYGILGHFSR